MADQPNWLTIPEWYQLARSHGATARYRIRRYGEGAWASEWCLGVQVVYPPGVECQVVSEDMKFVPDLKGRKGAGLTVEMWYDYDTTSYSVLIHDAKMSILGIAEPESEDDEADDNEDDDQEEESDDDGDVEESEEDEDSSHAEAEAEENKESVKDHGDEESTQEEDKRSECPPEENKVGVE